MGIDFKKTFGQNSAPAASGSDSAAAPKAKLWLNIGYDSGVVNEKTGETQFVALPLGIPLDTQEPLALSRNADYNEFVSARNDLLAQIMEHAENLAPGEGTVLNLQIQLRRVSDEKPVAHTGENRFAMKVDL